MEVKLYTNIDDDNVVNKNITLVATLTGDLVEDTDILDPVLLIENVSGVITNGSVNYVYIPDLHRYYYVLDISFVSGTLFYLTCHVDVLMTYKAQILENSGLIVRQEFNYNTMLSDPRLRVKANPLLQQLKFPNAFDGDYSYVMVVLGNSEE